jgi:hypothetical protein
MAQGVLTDRDAALADMLRKKRPLGWMNAELRAYWIETVRDIADTLFTRPVYEKPLTVSMVRWQEFTDRAGYLEKERTEWTEAELREAWGR